MMLFNKVLLNRTLKNKKYWQGYFLNSLGQHGTKAFYLWSSWNLYQTHEVSWIQKLVLDQAQSFDHLYSWEEYTLTNDDPRSPIHLHNMRLNTFIGSIAHNLGVLPRPLHHRVVHNGSEASPLCLLEIFMILDLKKKKDY